MNFKFFNSRRGQSWLMVGIAAVFLLILLISRQGGYLHPETAAFLQHYNAQGAWAASFDIERTDWGNYSARELSYLLDWCDARIIGGFIRHGWTHFYSTVNVLFLLAIVLVQQLGMRYLMPQLGRWIPYLLSGGFVVAQVSDCTNFFRSAKPGVALGVTLLLFGSYALWHYRSHPGTRATYYGAAGVVCSLIFLPLLDRQGSFYVAVWTMAAGLLLLVVSGGGNNYVRLKPLPERKLAIGVSCGVASVAAAALYNCWIGPFLIEFFNGYRPSFGFQDLGARWGDPVGGLIFLLDNCGFLLTRTAGYGALLSGALFLLLVVAVMWRYGRHPGQRVWTLGFIIWLAATLVCHSIMAAHHPLILRPDVIHSSYFLSALAALIFFIALAGSWQGRNYRRNIAWWSGILLIIAQLSCYTVPVRLSVNHLEYFQKTAPYVRYYLNHPEKNHREFPLPYSAVKLIDQFKKSSH